MSVGGDNNGIAFKEHFCDFISSGDQPPRREGGAGKHREVGDEKYMAHIGICIESILDKFDCRFGFTESVVEDVEVVIVNDGVMVFDRRTEFFGGERCESLVGVDVGILSGKNVLALLVLGGRFII